MTTNNPPLERVDGCPPVRPAAQGSPLASAPVSGPEVSLVEPNTSSSAVTPDSCSPSRPVGPRTGSRIGSKQRGRLRGELVQRDWRVLESLAQHRFLSSHQVEAFHFSADFVAGPVASASARAARRTLSRLHARGVIQLLDGRRVGGLAGGSTISIWYLTDAGYRLIRDGTSRYRIGVPTARFLGHTLAIADAHLAVLAAAQALAGTSSVQVEKQALRQMPGLGGGAVTLAPDLHVQLSATDQAGAYEDRWFMEVDCGTESLPTLLRKCEQYETYYRSGIEQAGGDDDCAVGSSTTGSPFPLVLWIFHGPRAEARLAQLRSRVSRSQRLTPELFRYATPSKLPEILRTGGAL